MRSNGFDTVKLNSLAIMIILTLTNLRFFNLIILLVAGLRTQTSEEKLYHSQCELSLFLFFLALIGSWERQSTIEPFPFSANAKKCVWYFKVRFSPRLLIVVVLRIASIRTLAHQAAAM